MKKGTLYFFTGLAGAGKTTIGGLFYEHLLERSPDARLMDGHQLRETAVQGGRPRDYSLKARREGAESTFAYCLGLTEEGRDVVCCSMSLFDTVREWNRAHFEHYVEIYLKVPMEILKERRTELYSGREPQVVGLDLPWDEPRNPDFVIENDGRETPEAIVERLEREMGLK